jgi:hypothetical protein
MEKTLSPLSKTRVAPPDLKSRRKLHQPRQKSNTRRFNSTNSRKACEPELPRKVFGSSLSELNENPIRPAEQYLSLQDTLRSQVQKTVKHDKARKRSPYSNNRYLTLNDRSPRFTSKVKNRTKVDLQTIQNFFFEFQAKSKLLLKQLEKNVLG